MKRYPILFTACLLILFSCTDKKDKNIAKTENSIESKYTHRFERILRDSALPSDSQKVLFKELANLLTNNPQKKEEAEDWYTQWVSYYEKQGDEAFIGRLNRIIGNTLCNAYHFDKGIPYLLKSTESFIKVKDYNTLGKAYNNLALAYHDFGDYTKGIEYATLALNTVKKHQAVCDKHLNWYAYNNLGINYDDSKQYTKAIESHTRALPFAANASDSSYSYNNLGNTHKKLKHYAEAQQYFTLSYNHSTDYEDVYHMATLYSNLMDIERLVKNYAKAASHIDSANFYAIKSKSPEKIIDVYYYTYLLKNETRDYSSATDYLNKYLTLKDSMFNAEKAKIVYDYQIKYETEKKEKEIVQTKLISNQKNIGLVLLGGSFLLGLALFRNHSIKAGVKHQQLALENKLLQEQTLAKMQEQRLDIARDLHDSIGAQLTLIQTVVDGLKQSKASSDDSLNGKINVLGTSSENAISELKNTLWVLNKDEITLQDLRIKIANLIKQTAEAVETIQFNFDYVLEEKFQLDSKTAITLFRAIQEIINNAVKYADASEMDIALHFSEKQLNIRISDNGKGFDYEKVKNKSFGLHNIDSRIKAINGQLLLDTVLGKGTTYTITMTV